MFKNFSGVGNDMRIENHLEWLCDRMVEKNQRDYDNFFPSSPRI